ncbi:MAG: hypothetical protein IPH57_05300 [Saprospiraceae bacterium]|nr:hypothetical protein [Saprospiraceae bacterium]
MVKYRILTTGELKATEKQFVHFLAVNGISSEHWERIKLQDQAKVDTIIEEFSDSIFESTLTNVDILEHRLKNSITLYYFESKTLFFIRIETKTDGYFNFDNEFKINELADLIENSSENISIYKGQKKGIEDKKMEFFHLLDSGCKISKNESLLQFLKELIREK